MNAKQLHLFNKYHELSCTHYNLLGIEYKGTVYAVPLDTNNNQLKAIYYACIRLSKPSKVNSKQGTQLRFTPSVELKRFLIKLQGTFSVCPIEHFNKLRQLSYIKNKGDAFELAVCQYYNIKWNGRTNKSFDIEPDLIINNIPYQLKYYDAQVTTEKTIKNAIARAI